MKFSTKSRYALRLMAELARYAPGTTVSLKTTHRNGAALQRTQNASPPPHHRRAFPFFHARRLPG